MKSLKQYNRDLKTACSRSDRCAGCGTYIGMGTADRKCERCAPTERVLYGTRKDNEDWQEEIISTNPAVFDKAKAWAKEQGFDRFRIDEIDLSTPPDFTKAIQ